MVRRGAARGPGRGRAACSGGRTLLLVHPLRTHNRATQGHQRNRTKTLQTQDFISLFERGGSTTFLCNASRGGVGWVVTLIVMNEVHYLPAFSPYHTETAPFLRNVHWEGGGEPRGYTQTVHRCHVSPKPICHLSSCVNHSHRGRSQSIGKGCCPDAERKAPSQTNEPFGFPSWPCFTMHSCVFQQLNGSLA
jgi:hypothetical protein